MTDNRGAFEPDDMDAQEVEAGDPAQAFDALRRTVKSQGTQIGAEMTILRRGVEAAFDRFESFQQPTDYSEDLAQIVENLALVGEHLEGLEKSPLLKNGPEYYAQALERSGEGLVKAAAQQLERQAAELERAGRNLALHVAGARERRSQDWWLLGCGGAGILVGIVLTLFLPALLPFSAAPRVASIVMGGTPWQAGMSLMAFDSPEAWNRVVAADQLFEANKAEVAACREAAAEAGEDQACTIIVPYAAQ